MENAFFPGITNPLQPYIHQWYEYLLTEFVWLYDTLTKEPHSKRFREGRVGEKRFALRTNIPYLNKTEMWAPVFVVS